MNEKQTILDLLQCGHAYATAAEAEDHVQKSEALARRANGYFEAANALLTAFSEFYDELIGHPQFVAARRFMRDNRF